MSSPQKAVELSGPLHLVLNKVLPLSASRVRGKGRGDNVLHKPITRTPSTRASYLQIALTARYPITWACQKYLRLPIHPISNKTLRSQLIGFERRAYAGHQGCHEEAATRQV